MKLILLVFIQMCLISLVFSDDPQKCGDGYDECSPGYTCINEVCVKVVPTTTTTTKKPTTTTPIKRQCCYSGNGGSNCFTCLPSYQCFNGLYCKYVPRTTTMKPTTTPKPPQPCDKYNPCPPGYECENEICVPIPTTTTKKPTPPKPTRCCWKGNRFRNCYHCPFRFTCYAGQYCAIPPTEPPTLEPPQCCSEGNFNACIVCFRPYICYKGKCYPPTRPPTKPPTTTQPTTTTPPPTTYKPCGENGECPEDFKCDYGVCIKKY